MKKFLVFSFAILAINCTFLLKADASLDIVKVAFNRDGNLWINTNGKDEKITQEPASYPYPPSWSHDGKWIAYMKESKGPENIQDSEYDIWVYNLETKKHKEIFQNGSNPKWSPVDNILAFQGGGVLNVSDLSGFTNISLGVADYSWFPDGKGFIASSVASLHPDGWTNPNLYKISLTENYEAKRKLTDAEKIFSIPTRISDGNVGILSIGASEFEFSPDGKWISFIVNPTASWSMDSNMLCTISSEGKNFEVIDEIIRGVDEPKWAYTKNRLGYIGGGGRIVLGFKDKDMKITELPASKKVDLTPPKYADFGFTWVNNSSLIVSRVKETDWSNDPKKRPNATLYYINMFDKKQEQITSPPDGLSDGLPYYLTTANKISWLRKNGIVQTEGDLWIADQDGKNARVWVKDIGVYSIYEGKRPK